MWGGRAGSPEPREERAARATAPFPVVCDRWGRRGDDDVGSAEGGIVPRGGRVFGDGDGSSVGAQLTSEMPLTRLDS